MNRAGSLIFSLFGYTLYTLAVVVVLLWYLFPTESCRTWLERQLASRTPSVEWEIGDLRLAWPLSLEAIQIRARGIREAAPLLTVDVIKFRPAVKDIAKLPNTVPLVYTMRVFKGSVDGSIAVNRKEGDVNSSGRIANVNIAGLEQLWQRLGRQASGTMSGTFTYQGKWQNLPAGVLQSQLQLQDGSVELLQPIMGLESFGFQELDVSVTLENNVVALKEGKVESELFAAGFNGTVALSDDLFTSDLDVKGWFEPRPELLASLKDQTMVRLVKSQLRNDRLQVTVTDTLLAPGIRFEGASGVIDGLIQRRGR